MASELSFTETSIQGDMDGRLRLTVTEESGNAQLGMIGCIRSRHYSSAATAAWAYQAEALDPLDTAAAGMSVVGASNGTVVTHTALSTNWTPVLGTDLGGTASLTHVGSYRWWARVHSTDGTAVQVRGVWDVGDLTLPVENTGVTIPGANNLYLVDLGEVRLDEVPVGTHRWYGQVQAHGAAGGEDVSIDKVWFFNTDEAYWKLTTPIDPAVGLATYRARDEFNQTAGTLTGKVLPVGGTWVGAGDADDFSVETTGKTAQRTAVSDANYETGRYAIAGSTSYTNVVVQADFKSSDSDWISASSGGVLSLDGKPRQGVFARYADTNNWFAVLTNPYFDQATLLVVKRVAGTVTKLVPDNENRLLSVTSYFTVRLFVDVVGRWFAWMFPQGGDHGEPVASGQDAVLATGGALATGKPGFYDAHTSAVAITRNVDNFAVWEPEVDAILHPNRDAELGTEGTFRQTADGTGWGPTPPPYGDLPRIPVSGLEVRPVEFSLLTSRGDLDQMPDTSAGTIGAQVHYQPSWLQIAG